MALNPSFLLTPFPWESGARPATFAALERWITTNLVGVRAPGLVAAVFDRDGVRWQRAYGVADARERTSLDQRSVFRWFSVTKVVTAMAVVQLAERGALSLASPVRRMLPWFDPQPWGDQVTVDKLLSHSSGLPNPLPHRWVHLSEEAAAHGIDFARSVFERNSRLREEPGREAYYSNLGYLVLEAVVEHVAGQRFDQYVRANVLEPAGMRDTYFTHYPPLAGRTATGHEETFHVRTLGLALAVPAAKRLVASVEGRFVRLRPMGLDGCGYGGLLGSMSDLTALGQLHLRGGGEVLSEKATREMRAPRARTGALSFGRAWWLGEQFGRPFVQHGGAAGGYRADMRLYPDQGLGIAALANCGGADTLRVVDQLGALDWG